jgi:hypothetical protein
MNITTEIIHFVLPDFSERIQLIFFSLMATGVVYTLISVYLSATPRRWEKIWKGGRKTGSELDAEHGTLEDICNAVATGSEKLADTMPGILLILGLLGTFLGLGIALNKASDILNAAGSAGINNDSMSNLVAMVQGLGTKFKTSTWGIIAFLLLKMLYCVPWFNFEENRLRWSIRKVKGEIDSKKNEEHKREEENNSSLKAIALSSEQSHKDMQALLSQGENQEKVLQKYGDTRLNVMIKFMRASQESSNAKLDAICTSISGDLISQQAAGFDRLARELAAQTKESDARILTAREEQHREAQERLSNAMRDLQKSSGDKLDAIRASISGDLAKRLEAQTKASDAMVESLRKTQAGMQKFVDENLKNLNKMQESSAHMSNASKQMTESTAHLGKSVTALKEGVESVMKTFKVDLKATIDDMSQTFGNNMGTMSKQMNDATHGIERAVNSLSSSVGDTMRTVESTIGKSMEMQTRASTNFDTTAETLNENVQTMTQNSERILKEVEGRLGSVAECGRQAKYLYESNKALVNDFTKLVEEFGVKGVMETFKNDLKSSLESVEKCGQQLAQDFKNFVEEFKERLPHEGKEPS